MKRSILGMMAAILTVSGFLLSCSDHDNPVAADDYTVRIALIPTHAVDSGDIRLAHRR